MVINCQECGKEWEFEARIPKFCCRDCRIAWFKKNIAAKPKAKKEEPIPELPPEPPLETPQEPMA